MKYELCKELKGAGFPQIGRGTYIYEDGSTFPDFETLKHTNQLDLVAYIPTLSELIEACCGRLEDLMQMRHSEPNKWVASAYSCDECGWEDSHVESGATPEEAVARLWLALNRKEI